MKSASFTAPDPVSDSNVDRLPTGAVLYQAQRNAEGQLVDFQLVRLNNAALTTWQRPEAELVGQAVSQLFPENDADFLIQQFGVVLKTGRAVRFEMAYEQCADEAVPVYEMIVSKHNDGVLTRYGDNSARVRRAEREQTRQSTVLLSVVENGKAGMTLFDPVRDETGAITDFRYVFTNTVNARNTGRSVAEMTGNTLLTLLPGVAQTEWYSRLMHTATTGQSESFLFGYEAESIRGWFDTLFVRVGDDQVLFTDLNVTALKDAELALQEQNRLLQQVVDNTQMGLLLLRPIRDEGEGHTITDFQYVLTNDYNARLGGKQVADMTGATVGNVFGSWQDSDLFRRIVTVAETGQAQRITFPYKDFGYSGWFDGSFATVNDCVLYTYTDVTSLKDAELAAKENAELLQTANLDLKRANENLKSFAYIASHDLQEPLRKLTSFADILNTQYAGRLDPAVADIVQRINISADRMRLLIQDLLAYSRIETKPDSFAPVNLPALIGELQDNELWAALRQSKAQLQIGVLPTLVADSFQMRQLFQNLLSNAVKFARKDVLPVVTVSSRLVNRADVPAGLVSPASADDSRPGGDQFYEIAVADNGIGFDEQYTDRIFQIFQRLHGRTQYAGSGIGLAICQRIVERHGGAITATSTLEQGSTFLVYLPR